ncbi:MAG: hypothetical protein ACXWC6_11055 [Ramlibacter sp.]
MYKQSVMAAALAAAFVAPLHAHAADDKDLAEIRAQIKQMKQSYEARLTALEQRLQDAQAALAQAQNAAAPAPQAPAAPATPATPAVAQEAPPETPVPAAGGTAAAANAFNPQISLVLAGTYANLRRDPTQYRLQGFLPPDGDVGPGARSFTLGESELTMAANIDPMFQGQLTFSLSGENTVSVEEGFMQTRVLGGGLNLKAGRFLSSIGYLNSQHAHAWDFVDAPLVYQAFLGGQYKPDGVQARWLAPTDVFLEVGAEFGSGRTFPGNDRNKNGLGSTAVFAHVGDDIGDSGSYRAGLSWLHTASNDRAYDENGVPFAFSGHSNVLIADAIYKWAPNGNPTQQNFKLQGEYMRRNEDGALSAASADGHYDRTQSGWYLQGVYQFMPTWRAGLRYDHLVSGTPNAAILAINDFGNSALYPSLSTFSPSRATAMVDWSPSEFSRFRLQLARDKSQSGASDNQIYLQYIMSLGTHAAHAF